MLYSIDTSSQCNKVSLIVTGKVAKQARVFVPSNPFKPSPIFLSNARAKPTEARALSRIGLWPFILQKYAMLESLLRGKRSSLLMLLASEYEKSFICTTDIRTQNNKPFLIITHKETK